MNKYEVMMVVDGDLNEIDARLNILGLLSLFENLPEYKEQVTFSTPLAYPIRGKRTGHRFVVNFELDDPSIIFEFNRLSLLNKNILRSLVINENKDRSFRTRNNPKKIKSYEIRREKYKQYQEYKKNQAQNTNSSSAS